MFSLSIWPIEMTTTLLNILNKTNVISMINAFIKSVLSFVMMEGMIIGYTAKDLQSNAGAFFAVVLAFLLRVAMDSKKQRPTPMGILSQIIITGALCFIAVYVWKDYMNYKKGFEIYLFIVSLFSVFIAGQLDSIFEAGFKKWARNFIGKIMAKDETGGVQ